MIHSFDIDDAKKYGITEAIILYNLQFWIEKNKANEKHFHDGRYWTYSSVKAFTELFPYLTTRNIRSALENLKNLNVILIGNYNQSSYDRTNWFALCHLSELTNQFSDCDKSSVNTDSKTDSKISDSQNKSLKRKTEAEEIIAYLNIKAFRNYKIVPANLNLIIARLKEGATKEECISVIDRKITSWLSDPKMTEYLRPATLFSAKNFAQYSGEMPASNNQSQGVEKWE